MTEKQSKINDYLQSGKIANPKLTLYAFHLRFNLAQGSETPLKDANNLWLKCQEIGQKLGIPKLQSLPEIIEKENSQASNINGQILPQGILPFTAIEHKAHRHLRGEVNPLQIHDTYALDLTLRYSEPEVQIADLSGLNPDKCLLPSNIKASLGQTLVLFAQPLGDIQEEQAFADACIQALLSVETVNKLGIYCQSQGKLLGSPTYEYNNDADSPQEQCHILIWLNTNPHTIQLEENGDYYSPLINLLNSRSKIIYARSQAIWCYQQARKEYRKLECKAILFDRLKRKHIDLQLKLFNKWLNEIQKISFNYARYLRDLQLQKITIQTNSKNYRLYLDTLKTICLKEDNLEFCLSFVEFAEDTFVEQINTDLAYLTPGKNFFDQMVNTIRGIVEIEQAKRDRSLERTVQVIGSGLAVGALVASSSPNSLREEPIFPPLASDTLHPFFFSFLVSFSAAAIAGLLVWLWTRGK